MISLAKRMLLQNAKILQSTKVLATVLPKRYMSLQQYNADHQQDFDHNLRNNISKEIKFKIYRFGGITKELFKIFVQRLSDDSETYNPEDIGAVLNVCSEFLLNATNDEAVQLFNDAWNKLSFIGYSVNHYNIMLNVLTHNKIPISLQAFHNLVSENKIKPNNMTFFYLLRGACFCGNMEEANAILQVMNTKNIGNHRNTISNLIIGNCVAGNYEEAKKIVEEANGLTSEDWPNRYLLEGYVRANNVEEIVKCLENEPNAGSYSFSLLSAILTVTKKSGEDAVIPLLKFIPKHTGLCQKANSVLQPIGAFKTAFEFLKRNESSSHPLFKVEEYIEYAIKTYFENAEEFSKHIEILLPHAKQGFQYRCFNTVLMEEIKRKEFSAVDIVEVLKKHSQYSSDQFFPNTKCHNALEKINEEDSDFVEKFRKKYFKMNSSENTRRARPNFNKVTEDIQSLFLDLEGTAVTKYLQIAPINFARHTLPPVNCAELSNYYPQNWNDTTSLFVFLMLSLKGENYCNIQKLIKNKPEFVELLNQLDLGYVLAERKLENELDIFLELTVGSEHRLFEKYAALLKAERFEDARNLLNTSTMEIDNGRVMNFMSSCTDFNIKKELVFSLKHNLPQNALIHFVNSAIFCKRIDVIEETATLVETEPTMFSDKMKINIMDALIDNGKDCNYVSHYLKEDVVEFRKYLHLHTDEEIAMESIYEKINRMDEASRKVIKFSIIDSILHKCKPEEMVMWKEKITELIPSYETRRPIIVDKRRTETVTMDDLEEITKESLTQNLMTKLVANNGEKIQDKLLELIILKKDSGLEELEQELTKFFTACAVANTPLSDKNVKLIIAELGIEMGWKCVEKSAMFLLHREKSMPFNVGKHFKNLTKMSAVFGKHFLALNCYVQYAQNCLRISQEINEVSLNHVVECHTTLTAHRNMLSYRGIYVVLLEQLIMKKGGASRILGKQESEV